MNRYQRQILLPFIAEAGQRRLAASRVLIVGCGALGGTVAEQLCRAGIGTLALVDRDWVEWTNLQRQVLFDESDARDATPKAVAAAKRLSAINSSISIKPHVADLDAETVERLAGVSEPTQTRADVIVDATDNVESRYLINDVSVKHGIPWVYGGCVGSEGRVMTVRPNVGPCLRCVFPVAPAAGEVATCDTAGVLGPAAAVVASLQAAAVMRLLLDQTVPNGALLSIDIWQGRFGSIELDRDFKCPCCHDRQFDFLWNGRRRGGVSLCGRNSVQIRLADGAVDLPTLLQRLLPAGEVQANRYLLRFTPSGEEGIKLTIFPDSRVIVQGTADSSRARTIVSRYLGA